MFHALKRTFTASKKRQGLKISIYKFALIAIISIMTSPAIFSQTTANVWDFRKCAEHIIKENISIKQARLNLEQSGYDLSTLRQGRIPSLSGSVNQNLNTGRVIDPFTNAYNEQTINSASFNLNSSVTLFNGFQLNNQIKQQHFSFLANQADLEVTQNNILLQMANLYLQILQNKEFVEMSEAQLAISKASLDRNQKLFDAGTLRPDLLSNLKAQYANDELNVVTARNTLQMAKVNLQLLLMLKCSDDFDIVKPSVMPGDGKSLMAEGIDRLFEQALGNSQTMKSVENKAIVSDYGIKIAKGQHYPRLSLFGNINTLWSDSRKSAIPGSLKLETFPIGFVGGTFDTVFGVQNVAKFQVDGFSKQVTDNLGQTIGLSLSVPIYSQGQISNSVRRAKLNKQIADFNVVNQRNTLYQDVARAYTEYKSALSRLDANQKSYDAQKEAFTMTQARFDAGLVNVTDFTISKSNFQRAELNLIQTKYEVFFKEKILEFYRSSKIEIR
jgi:outer membrane protein